MTTVGFDNLDDFIAELRGERDLIADKIVRWQLNRTPEQAEGFSFEVDVWATAVRKGGDESYLMEFGNVAGFDNNEEGTTSGTDSAATLKAKLTEACDDMGMKLRPGKIEVF